MQSETEERVNSKSKVEPREQKRELAQADTAWGMQ